MNGIEEIIIERINQLDNHKYKVDNDVKVHLKGELRSVAVALILNDSSFYPLSWNEEQYKNWMCEDRVKQLAIAGAFLAAEIDRIKEQSVRNERLQRYLDKNFDLVNITYTQKR